MRCRDRYDIAYVSALLALAFGSFFWHWILLRIGGLLQDFAAVFAHAIDQNLGFKWLHVDSWLAREASADGLYFCGVEASICSAVVGKPRFALDSIAQGDGNFDFSSKLESLFERSLFSILWVATDKYLDFESVSILSPELQLSAEALNTMRSRTQTCYHVAVPLCKIYGNLGRVFQHSAVAEERMLKFTRVEVPQICDVCLEYSFILHGFPYVVFASTFLWKTSNLRNKNCACVAFFGHMVIWWILFVVALACCVAGVEAHLGFGVIPLPMLKGTPSASAFALHVKTMYPSVWQDVFIEWASIFEDIGLMGLLLAASFCCAMYSLRRPVFEEPASVSATARVRKTTSPATGGVRRSLGASAADIVQDSLTRGSWSPPPSSELDEIAKLSACQIEALAHVRQRCWKLHTAALPKVKSRAKRLGFSEIDVDTVLEWIREDAPIIIHIDLARHASQLANDTHYRNQFETFSSGGTFDPRKRIQWENELFGEAYSEAKPAERCKYGVINASNDPRGVKACRQYGCSYLLLRNVRLRTTFSATDSAGMSLDDLATVDYYAHVLNQYSDAELADVIRVSSRKQFVANADSVQAYKEAQIHGEILLDTHIELIMVHPSLKNDLLVRQALDMLAHRGKLSVGWIEGGIDGWPLTPRPSPTCDISMLWPACSSPSLSPKRFGMPADVADASHISLDTTAEDSITVSRKRCGETNPQVPTSCEAGSSVREPAAMSDIRGFAEAASSATFPQEVWETQVNGTWLPLTGEALLAVRKARSENKPSASFEARMFPYTIDFEKCAQINETTGNKRPVRCRWPIVDHDRPPVPIPSSLPGMCARPATACEYAAAGKECATAEV